MMNQVVFPGYLSSLDDTYTMGYGMGTGCGMETGYGMGYGTGLVPPLPSTASRDITPYATSIPKKDGEKAAIITAAAIGLALLITKGKGIKNVFKKVDKNVIAKGDKKESWLKRLFKRKNKATSEKKADSVSPKIKMENVPPPQWVKKPFEGIQVPTQNGSAPLKMDIVKNKNILDSVPPPQWVDGPLGGVPVPTQNGSAPLKMDIVKNKNILDSVPPPQWVEKPFGDLQIPTGSTHFKVDIRNQLPKSFSDTIEAENKLFLKKQKVNHHK